MELSNTNSPIEQSLVFFLKDNSTDKNVKNWVTKCVKHIFNGYDSKMFRGYTNDNRVYKAVLPLFMKAAYIKDGFPNNDIAYCGSCMRFLSLSEFKGKQHDIAKELHYSFCSDCSKSYIKTVIDRDSESIQRNSGEMWKEIKNKSLRLTDGDVDMKEALKTPETIDVPEQETQDVGEMVSVEVVVLLHTDTDEIWKITNLWNVVSTTHHMIFQHTFIFGLSEENRNLLKSIAQSVVIV